MSAGSYRSAVGPFGRLKGVARALDRALYALFSRWADADRHDADRRRYRGTTLTTSFDVYLARVYGLSWLVAALAGTATLLVLVALSPSVFAVAGAAVDRAVPVGVPAVPRGYVAVAVVLPVALTAKRLTVRLGGRYLGWAARARRTTVCSVS